ncbi:MAG: BON domain-containing protein [Gammaproteobacteria bacterium]|nr:BON domain-containing protein [Gammaproteobacteria bacterium]
MRRLATILLLATATFGVGGCAPLVVGGTATATSVADDKRSVGTVVDDTLIKLRAEAAISAHRALKDNTHIDATSINGVVLLTGEARTRGDLDRVLTIVRTLGGVRKIINQIRVAPPSPFAARLDDSWITLRVKAALVGQGLNANRIKVVTAGRVVYLMGLVNPAAAAAAAQAASHVPNVRSVVELFQYT